MNNQLTNAGEDQQGKVVFEGLTFEQMAGREAEPAESYDAQRFLDLARDTYNASTNYFDTVVRPDMERNLRQYNGQFEANSKYAKPAFSRRSRIYSPNTRNAMTKHEAALTEALFANEDVVNISAFDESDPIAVASAAFFKELLNIRLTGEGDDAIPWLQIACGLYQDAHMYGHCIAKTTWDFDSGMQRLEHLDVLNFRFHPASNYINPIKTSPYLIERIPFTVGKLRHTIKKNGWLPVTDEEMLSARSDNGSTTRSAREGGRQDALDSMSSVKDHDTVWVHLNIQELEGVDFIYYTLGTTRLLTIPQELSKVFPDGRPYVMGFISIEPHKNYPDGLPKKIRPLINELNDIRNKRLDNVEMALMKKIILKRGSRVSHDALVGGPYSAPIELSDPQKDIKWMETPDVTGSSYNEANILSAEIDNTAGTLNMANISSDQSQAGSVGALNMMNQTAGLLGGHQLKIFGATCLEPILRQLLKLSQRHESNKLIMKIAGKRAEISKKFGISVLDEKFMEAPLSLKISIGTGATNPVQRVERMALAVSKVSMLGPQVASQLNTMEIVKEMFGALGYKDGGRFVNTDGPNPEVQALQQQVQELQQKLANTRNPEIDAAEAMQKRAAATKTMVEATFGAVQAATTLVQVKGVSGVADVIMQSAGYRPPQPGIDPNFPASEALGSLSPEARAAAASQAQAINLKENTDPQEPATGVGNFNVGIRGGQNGVSDRG